MPVGKAGHGMGVDPNSLRHGAPTGRILIRWEGALDTLVWTGPAPDMDPQHARLELARRYLHIFGPTTAQSFGEWAGIKPPAAHAAFEALGDSLLPVRTPIGDAWILASDESELRSKPGPAAAARLLPSGDTYYLLWRDDRKLLVPNAKQRAALWTSRVWPGALLVNGEIAGVWRRAGGEVSMNLWRRITRPERKAIEAEVMSLPVSNPSIQVFC
jgi:hypothetical protein